jgi:hypothetical protein
MPIVELDDQEWQQVISMIATAPWRDANPLLMKIGSQLRVQALGNPAGGIDRPPNIRPKADGKEAPHE